MFRVIFGRQHSVVQTELTPEKLPLGSLPNAGGGRRARVGVKSKSQMAVSSMRKKTFKGQWTKMARVCSHIYL